MQTILRNTLSVLFSAFLVTGVHSVMAQGAYPDHPIKLIVPFSAGGGTDVVARAFAKGLSEKLKQPVIVDNRAGAGSTIGTDMVAKSAADGYTLLFASAAYSFAPAVYAKLPYALEDLTAIAVVNSTPLVLAVNPAVPAKDLRSFIALLKLHPGKYNFASSGVGTTLHIAAEHFVRSAGVSAQHIAYKGEAPAMTDLLGGQVSFMVGQASSAVQYVKTGRLIALGVTTPKRLASLPEVPTLSEAGLPGFAAYGWNAVLAPKGTPRAIVDKLNNEINAVIASAELQKVFAELGLDRLDPATPEGAASFIAAETTKWTPVIRAAGVKAE
jgi:tripartite-type tricarboxylate transporter receptor subunit TctC